MTKNPVTLLCELAEGITDRFQARPLYDQYGGVLRFLVGVGAVMLDTPLTTVTCRACYADHTATVEYNAQTRRHFHFCSESGLVTVDDADLATLRFDPEWLLDWLACELPVLPPIRRRALVRDGVWHLGDTVCDNTPATFIFARRVSSQAALDLLWSVLRTVHPTNIGLVMTTSSRIARQVPLPNGFEFLDLGDIARSVGDRLIVDRTNLDSRVRRLHSKPLRAKRSVQAFRNARKEPSRLDYREADKPFIAEMHALIVSGDAHDPTDAARAVAHRAPGSGQEASKVTRLHKSTPERLMRRFSRVQS